MNGVLLDSARLIALWNRRDERHDTAVAAFSAIPESTELFATSYVIAECGNAFSRSEIRRLVSNMGEKLLLAKTLIFPTDADWSEAWTAFRRGHAGSPSLVDQISFAVMRRLELRRAFTHDRHFGEAGFEATH